MRRGLLVLGILCALAAGVAHQGRSMAECSSSYVQGLVGGESKCLRAGEFCSPGREADYERYGFSCVDGRLRSGGTAPAAPTAGAIGATVGVAPLTRGSACRRGALADRPGAPGADHSGL